MLKNVKNNLSIQKKYKKNLTFLKNSFVKSIFKNIKKSFFLNLKQTNPKYCPL